MPCGHCGQHVSTRQTNSLSLRFPKFPAPVMVLGALAKFRKATISFVMCLSVRMEQLGSQSTDFRDTFYLSLSQKSVDKIEVSLKSDKKNGYFT
jgi:hypothetical protein